MEKNPGKSEPFSEHVLIDHPEYLKAIGMIAVETVDLQLHLANLFARMLHISPRVGQAICLSAQGEKTRIDIIRHAAIAAFSLATNANPESVLSRQKTTALKKMEGLLDRSWIAITKRHRVIHDDWDVSAEKAVTRKLIDGRPKRSKSPIQITELEAQIIELRSIIDEVRTLTQQFRERPPLMIDLRISRTKAS